MPLFPYSMYEAGAHGMFDDGSDPLIWLSALLVNIFASPAGKARSLVMTTSLSCRLQFAA